MIHRLSVPHEALHSGPLDRDMVLLHDIAPDILLDVKYATEENFTGQILYPVAHVYLRRIVAIRLAEVQRVATAMSYSLKVFDGYRPLSVQKKMWALLPDERYVANPAKGSRHNRGAAVDLTLVDGTGKELDMGTPYDNFTEKAHSTYQDLPASVLANRSLLAGLMTAHSFHIFSTEWWHFDFAEWEQFDILDIPIV